MQCPLQPNSPVYNLPEIAQWRDVNGYEICSYCGSLHPDKFFELIAAGEELIPTDKNYKVYVGSAHKKFYFEHLSEDQKKFFVEQLNQKRIKFGIPGHFYVLPFFIGKK